MNVVVILMEYKEIKREENIETSYVQKFNQNLERLRFIEDRAGNEAPNYSDAFFDIEYILMSCKRFRLAQPEIFPFADFSGIQAQWDYKDFYIEVASSGDNITVYWEDETDYEEYTNCNIVFAFCYVKEKMREMRQFAFPPGISILEQMGYYDVSIEKLAKQLGMSVEQTEDLIDGYTKIDSEIADKLEHIFEVPASYWINLEKIFREKLQAGAMIVRRLEDV